MPRRDGSSGHFSVFFSREGIGNTAQFVGSVGDAFSAICCLQIFRFTSSKPSKSAIASDEKFIRLRTNSFVRYCLKNEKYAGDLLLQKFYTNNHVEKKRFHNRGELPQYFVGEDHEPIIDRETFDAVQREIAWRAARRKAAKAQRDAQETASVASSGEEHTPQNTDRESFDFTSERAQSFMAQFSFHKNVWESEQTGKHLRTGGCLRRFAD